MGARRVGLLGGTFDPVHLGHVDLALACLGRLKLDEVRLLPARTPPHKPAASVAAPHRFAMVALAASVDARLVPDPRELEREGPSWTIDTIEEILHEEPGLELHLLLGADSLRDFATWRRWEEIARLAIVVATGREGVDLDAAARQAAGRLPPDRLVVVDHEPPPWSSRDVRRRLLAGDPCRDALDPLVSDYVRKCNLLAGGAEAPRKDLA